MNVMPNEISTVIDRLLALSEPQRGETLQQVLLEQPDALTWMAAELGLKALTAEELHAAEIHFEHVSLNDAVGRKVLPVRWQQQEWLLLSDPFSLDLRQWAQRLPVTLAIAPPLWLQEQLQALAGQQRTMDQLEQQVNEGAEDEMILEITPAIIANEANPIIKLLNATLYDAMQSRASDIHLSAVPDGLAVKYRVDGVIHAIRHCQGIHYSEQVISRLKVLSNMDISERRVPQDGRFKAIIHQRPVDFRVSIVPGIHGEDAVLRVLDKSHSSTLSLEILGFDDHTLREIRQLTNRPHGMVLVTGPTGSGKSTTLYAALSELNNGESKIITIEDPVEYQLNDVLQIPVNDKKGLTFARGLRAILRHDPDTILVGEIRDSETAGIAVQAALTGHLVLSTVHANDVFSVLERFLYMNVETESLLTALQGVLAQRLVRSVCPDCQEEVAPTEQDLAQWQQSDLNHLQPVWRKGRGCPSCRQSGYRGRLALAEILPFNDVMKEALQSRMPVRQLREIALAQGFVPLHNVAIRAVLEGKTTFQEINRVITAPA
ncbi:type II/IV secretion system protein [Kosakonia radicincitans]|uniref:General secretion pathway protein E n=1 Tax=Kosakonia radicincitans TaxID=283686 RepID=A0AAX2ELD7_9ENTR|nr:MULTISPECIES: ATPase, T2SS/T4P/T4SS family [Kosakonia]MDP9565147.1 general secretion pathway protein E [Kosakonia oryzae]KDE36021.1 type II secretion system protein E [Kosakonia radicincitans UMEnt01/12]MDD7994053.1 ATPase, T2SS/T4P/T4SS family [Kosakonia radicincitans]PTA93781.1 type II/IV secretion system protein [Kosakonia sp. H7A]QEM92868.1 type II/IV secretion system protein [Kosakonia radicincitans]